MTGIAILGATSQLAKDYIALGGHDPNSLLLYARSPEKVEAFLRVKGLQQRAFPLDTFGQETCDTIINFIGVGDPAKAKELGAGIFDITLSSDRQALDYLAAHPATRYVFISSGAAYGTQYDKPVDAFTQAVVPVNNLQPQDYYGTAKLCAEVYHRTQPHSIIDIRIFSYVSRSLDLSTRFLLADIANSIKNKTTFYTDQNDIYRDYLGPADLCQLLNLCILAPSGFNAAIDAFSLAPIGKLELLKELQAKLGLKVEIKQSLATAQNTGHKPFYYSNNRIAETIGFKPKFSSIEAILFEIPYLLTDA